MVNNRYRRFLEEARNEGKSVPSTEKSIPEDQPEANEDRSSEVGEKVIRSVGNRMQKKAGLLLDHLKKSKVIQWNEDGEISYRGKPIPQSNIVDLVSNTLKTRSRKGFATPTGTNEFAQALKETNVPVDYVQNPDLIKAMQRPGNISTPVSLLTSKEYDDTGFHEASSISPYLTPGTIKKKTLCKIK